MFLFRLLLVLRGEQHPRLVVETGRLVDLSLVEGVIGRLVLQLAGVGVEELELPLLSVGVQDRGVGDRLALVVALEETQPRGAHALVLGSLAGVVVQLLFLGRGAVAALVPGDVFVVVAVAVSAVYLFSSVEPGELALAYLFAASLAAPGEHSHDRSLSF